MRGKQFVFEVGDPAPKFCCEDQEERLICLDDLKGKKLILFFYPKDNTPSCTKEACSLRDGYDQLTKKGFTIFGISPDKAASHRRFIEKYGFQYSLLADPKREVIDQFGLSGPKLFMGRMTIGVYRTTILIDKNGIITNIIYPVNTANHAQQILDLIDLPETD